MPAHRGFPSFYFLLVVWAASLATAKTDIWAALSKPPLRPNFDDFQPILASVLPETHYNIAQWASGWIPSDCKGYAKDHNVKAEDFITYQVQYADCSDPWIMCYHKNSEISMDNIAIQFGRLPVQMREWVKHVVTIPDSTGWAYMDGANTVYMKPSDKMQTTMVHETAHAVDLNGGYNGTVLSGSAIWTGNYSLDSHVPDPYSRTDTVEDIAQNTVIAVLNENAPGPNGGFATIEPNWTKVFNQYDTIITQARHAGRGNSMIVPGQNVACVHRMPNSEPVVLNTLARVLNWRKPDVSLSSHVTAIRVPPKRRGPTNCSIHW
ncbi:conidiation-specific protein [Apiospora arundinis]|uniref:Conidiation-specific protein n=1 Tax=Apiospora arundinis TaxID=335852 RepID=A0ABR2JMB0_9PEZI